jgi:hypothetical protein
MNKRELLIDELTKLISIVEKDNDSVNENIIHDLKKAINGIKSLWFTSYLEKSQVLVIDLTDISNYLDGLGPENLDGWSDAVLDALEHEYELETQLMATIKENALTDDEYIRIAYDHLGSAIRDNTREEKIEMGKKIENGTWETEE